MKHEERANYTNKKLDNYPQASLQITIAHHLIFYFAELALAITWNQYWSFIRDCVTPYYIRFRRETDN